MLAAVKDSHNADVTWSSESTLPQQYAVHAPDSEQDTSKIAAGRMPLQLMQQSRQTVDTATASSPPLRSMQRPHSTDYAAGRLTTAESIDCSLCSPCANREQTFAEDNRAVEGLPDEPQGLQQQTGKQKHGKRRRAANKQSRQSRQQPSGQVRQEPKRVPLVMSKCYADVVGCREDDEECLSIR